MLYCTGTHILHSPVSPKGREIMEVRGRRVCSTAQHVLIRLSEYYRRNQKSACPNSRRWKIGFLLSSSNRQSSQKNPET
jgi:hypothetical protein